MLKRAGVNHMLRAAAAIAEHDRFVLIGSGSAIATQKNLPLDMMLTSEIDIYADGVTEPESLSELLAAVIGRDSMFHRTFHYYVDGVSPTTATLPDGWRDRLIPYTTPEAPGVTALCLEIHDLAVAKLCAGREKDIVWLRAGLNAGLVKRAILAERLDRLTDPRAPNRATLDSRIAAATVKGA
ncbi:hypothetical protein J4558_16520 [Leptolyngbya sp. 15MV]|nr:hypothetical protein J4558_16520 [Leptolyngbya sp. 15MV]